MVREAPRAAGARPRVPGLDEAVGAARHEEPAALAGREGHGRDGQGVRLPGSQLFAAVVVPQPNLAVRRAAG